MKKRRKGSYVSDRMYDIEEKYSVIELKAARLEIMSSFSRRPKNVDPEKLEVALISMSIHCGEGKCLDCQKHIQMNCLIVARHKFLKSPYWRLSIDELSCTVLGLLAGIEGGPYGT